MTKLTVNIDDDLHHKLTISASIRKVSMKEIVEKALESELNDNRDKKNLERIWGSKKK
jgi:predicted HicB family RNase H-like nuclease